MQRMMIIGGAGSGKSSLAHQIGDITSLPVIYIDKFYWKPSWKMRICEEIGALTQSK